MRRRSLHRACGVLFVAAACCATTGCGKVAKMALKGTLENVGAEIVDNSSDDSIRQMFEQADALCPTRMDAYTTLESVKMIDDRRVEFRYQVNNEGKNLARRFNKDLLRKAAVDHMKGNAMAMAIAKRDLSVEHIYEDVFGGHILSYTINKQVLAGNDYPTGDRRTNPFNVQTVKADPKDQVNVKNEKPADEETEPAASSATPDLNAPLVEPPAEIEPPKPELPQQIQPQKRTKENPAGVQSNPFFDA